MRIIYNLQYCSHTRVFFTSLHDLITHKTVMILYKANIQCLEGRVQVFLNQLQPHTRMILDSLNYFIIKQKRTPPTDNCQILSEVFTYGMA